MSITNIATIRKTRRFFYISFNLKKYFDMGIAERVAIRYRLLAFGLLPLASRLLPLTSYLSPLASYLLPMVALPVPDFLLT